MVRLPSAISINIRLCCKRVALGHFKAQLIYSSLRIKRLFKMASISIEIGFIMAAMNDSKPSTTFVFPASASNRKRHPVAKQARSKIDESRYSTDSESSLKGKSIHLGLIHALFRQLIRTCVNSCKQTYKAVTGIDNLPEARHPHRRNPFSRLSCRLRSAPNK